jgi:hypothetical protein
MLDKDGSTMLNPVGYVDYGRIAQDTGHTFTATKEAAPAIAARYYMNRNYFVNDPDAFTVSQQTIPDHAWNGGKVPLTLDEAKASIALSAVAGSMFEIGDDLTMLGSLPDRMALVTNRELIRMARSGKASVPVDLMTFDPADEQPSIFLLKENGERSVLAIFNWTEQQRSHVIDLVSLGLDSKKRYRATDIFGSDADYAIRDGHLSVIQPAHSARMILLRDTSLPSAASKLEIFGPKEVKAGFASQYAVRAEPKIEIDSNCSWSFGDGVSVTGETVKHAYTQPGEYLLSLQCIDADDHVTQKNAQIKVDGHIPSVFVPSAKQRLIEQ